MSTTDSKSALRELEAKLKAAEEVLYWRTEELSARNDEFQAQTEILIKRRKQLDEARQQAEDGRRHLEQLLSSIGDVLIGVNVDQEVNQWNVMAESVLGVNSTDVLNTPLRMSGVRWDWELFAGRIDECLRTGSVVRIEKLSFTRPDETPGFLGVTINLIKEGSGQPQGFVIIAQETTERYLLEAQLAQAQKLESIGRLAAGIAHEINTPIQFIGDNTRFLKDSINELQRVLAADADALAAIGATGSLHEVIRAAESARTDADVDYLMAEIPRALKESLDGIERISKIVLAMKEFSHPGTNERIPIDLNRAIESTIAVSRNEWKYVAEIQTDLDPGMPPVLCLPGELNQVVLNMIVNAAHAIDDRNAASARAKGVISITTTHEGGQAVIQISDDGSGMPEETRKLIFDPFFTTKEIGKGTGQGLAIARSVVVGKHDGTIDVRSEVGVGTTFVIRLPSATSHLG
jgi:PAS domain S-box-containing protein